MLRRLCTAGETPYFTQVVMNLPASAVEFLDAFIGLYADCPVGNGRAVCAGWSASKPTGFCIFHRSVTTHGLGELSRCTATACHRSHRGLPHAQEDVALPTVNVYCFSKAADPIADAQKQVENVLECTLPAQDIRYAGRILARERHGWSAEWMTIVERRAMLYLPFVAVYMTSGTWRRKSACCACLSSSQSRLHSEDQKRQVRSQQVNVQEQTNPQQIRCERLFSFPKPCWNSSYVLLRH
jgi:hypothetical protein